MKNESYITIQGWMVNELKLTGNELLCYALIYGFSQDGESCFNGNRKYIASVLGAKSLNSVDKVLKKLTENNLIIKHSNTANGITFNTYKTNTNFKNEHPTQNLSTPYSKNEYPPQNLSTPYSKNEYPPQNLSTPHSKNEYPPSKFEYNNTIENTIENIKEKENNKLFSEKKSEVEVPAFVPPTFEELDDYIRENGFNFSAEKFLNHYKSNGWMVGPNPMKDWKSTCNGWEIKEREKREKIERQPNVKNWREEVENVDYVIENGTKIYPNKSKGQMIINGELVG